MLAQMKKIILLFLITTINYFYSQGLKFDSFFSQEKQSFTEKFSPSINEISQDTYFIIDIKDKYIYTSMNQEIFKFEIFAWNFENTSFECFDKKNGGIAHIEIPKNRKYIIVANECESNSDKNIVCNKRKVFYNKGDLKIGK